MTGWSVSLYAATQLTTTITPCLGRNYRPGAWLQVQARVKMPSGCSGVFVPELHLLSPVGGNFVCRLQPMRMRESEAYLFTFWAIAGSDTPRLMVQLVGRDNQKVLRGRYHEHVIIPLPPGKRLIVRPGKSASGSIYNPALLPRDPAAYESCDAIVLGAITGKTSGRSPSPANLKAVSTWMALGGIVLTLDNSLAEVIAHAAEKQGIRPGGKFPFVLPTPKRIDEILQHPQARRIGRGLMINLSGKDAGHKVRLGRAAWKRIAGEFSPAQATDLRLRRRRYRILDRNWPGWPPPPQPETRSIARWLMAWAALMAAALVAGAIRRSPARTGIAACAISILLAFAFLRNNPKQSLRILHARTRLVGQAGSNGPTVDEDLWLVTPFSSQPGTAISFRFRGTPPPRLLVYDHNQLASLNLAVELAETWNRIIVCAPRGKAIGRGFPMIFSRKMLGRSLPVPNLILRETGQGLSLLMPDTVCGRLESAILHTRANTFFMDSFDGQALPPKSSPEPDTPRARIMRLLAGEHQPGDYATLMGWEPGPAATKSDLGVLRIYGIANIIRE